MDYRRYIEYQTFVPVALVQTFLTGFVSGALTWLLALGLEKYVLTPIMCGGNNSACGYVTITAVVIALIVAHFLGLIALIRSVIMRPLLVILAVIATLWGFHVWVGDMSWWLGTLYAAVLFGLAYMYYAWVNRLLFFPVALILTIISVVAARLLLAAW
ncbi:MAG: hypothetical protein WAW60_03390 [Candidatus Saccharimonadales bacterium]